MQFLFPGFLFSFALLAIPIVIHLFNFRRFKKVVFSDIRFLKELTEQNKKQQRLKHLLILASRLLALSALILAFAQPFLPARDSSTLLAQHKVNVYIDNSASMEALASKGNLLEEAKASALSLLDSYTDKDEFQILSNDFEGKQQRWLNKKDAKQAIESIVVSGATRDANEVLNRQKALHAGLAVGESFWFSDFQNNLNVAGIANSDSLFALNAIQLSTNKKSNVWVDSAWFPEPVLRLGSANKLKVRIRNGGENNWENQAIRLSIDGTQVGLKNISCAAGASETVDMVFSLNDAEVHGMEVSLTDFPISFDDVYYLSAAAVKQLKVLEIGEGNPGKAFQLVFGLDSIYQYQFQDLGSLNFTAFSEKQLIILNQPREMSSALGEALSAFLKAGGQVVFIPGNTLGAGLSNWFLKEGVSFNQLQSNLQNIDKPDLKHPLLEKVFAKFPQMPAMPFVKQWYAYTTTVPAKKVLGLVNGQAWLSELKKGKGSLYVFGSAITQPNSDLSRNALFVPLLLNLPIQARYVLPVSFTLGKESSWQIDNGIDAKVVQLQGMKREYRAEVTRSQQSARASLNETIEKAGIYTLFANGRNVGKVAFNYPRAESWMEFEKADAIAARFNYLEKEKLGAFFQERLSQERGKPLWQWFLIAALLFVLTEIALVRFMK